MAFDPVTRLPLDPAALSEVDQPVYDWLTQHFGAPPENFCRQLRWRIGWEADVQVGGETKTVIVRGNRGDDYQGPSTMHQEGKVHGIMERHGVPAPHVYGMIEDPLCIVMEKISGGINSELAGSDAVKWKVRSEFIQALTKLHAIPVEEFGEIGMFVPQTPQETALSLYRPCIDIVRKKLNGRPFGLVEFFALWLERNAPAHRTRRGFVTGDAGQFLYDGDKFTGLIDFEVSYVGDPAAEFAGMRLRNTTEPLGDISKLCDYYESLTGDRISKEVIEYHSAGFAGTNSMLMWPMMFEPEKKNDFVAYLHFCVCTSRWALQGIAEAIGVKLNPVPDPVRNPMIFESAPPLLVSLLNEYETKDGDLKHHLDTAGMLATYLQHSHEYGASIIASEIEDTRALTGKDVQSREEADIAVDAFVRQAGPEHDAALTQFFHRWLERHNFLLKGCGPLTYLTESMLQYIPPRH
jgi:aminoglycoside phosphotransferase (APT) family kinase protein